MTLARVRELGESVAAERARIRELQLSKAEIEGCIDKVREEIAPLRRLALDCESPEMSYRATLQWKPLQVQLVALTHVLEDTE